MAIRLQSIVTALLQVRQLLEDKQFRAAQNVALKGAERFPDFQLFRDLISESAFLEQESAAEYLRQVERKLATENDFATQAEILRTALQSYPEEAYFRDGLQLVQNKQALLDAAIGKARELESRGLYEDAKRGWEDLGKLYPWLSIVGSELGRLASLSARNRAAQKERRITQIKSLLQSGDWESAHEEINTAFIEFPGDPALKQLAQQVEREREKQKVAKDAFWRGEELLKAGRVREACESLRVAFESSLHESELKKKVIAALLAAAEERIPDDWKNASLCVDEAIRLQPQVKIPIGVSKEIAFRRREEELAQFLDRLKSAEVSENWDEALDLISSAKRKFSGDSRLETAERRVDAAKRQFELERTRAEALRQIEALRSSIYPGLNKRRLTKLRTIIDENEWLKSQDTQISQAATLLSQELDAKIAATATTKPKLSPVMLIAAACVLGAVAIGSYFLLSRGHVIPVDFALTPEQVRVHVGSYSCVTPNCSLKLPPGHYDVQFSKDGFTPLTLPLDVRAGQPTAHLEAALTTAVPMIQIAGNLENGSVTLDGASVGDLRNGRLGISTVTPGKHVLALSQASNSASVPFEVNQNGQSVLSGSPVANSLSVVAVDQTGGSATLATSIRSPVRVSLDGTSIGSTANQVLKLPALQPGYRKLRVSSESDNFDFDLTSSSSPTLDLFVVGKSNVGTLVVTANASDARVLMDQKVFGTVPEHGELRAIVPAGAHTLQAVKDGYTPTEAVHVSVYKGSDTSVQLQLTAKPASLEIVGAASGTVIQVDRSAASIVSKDGVFKRSVPPGEHRINLSRPGFLAKQIDRRFKPGETVALSGSEVDLAPATANELALESSDWDHVNSSKSIQEIQAFLQKHPAGAHAGQAQQKLSGLEWGAVQKNNASSLQDFLNRHPQSPYGDEARKLLTNLSDQQKAEAENNDWNATDKTKLDSLHGFLSRHPNGPHSQNAQQLISQLSKPNVSDSVAAEESAWASLDRNDPAAVVNFIARFPSGTRRADADSALAALKSAKQQGAEAAGVIATLKAFAGAWQNKDIDGIVSAQPALTKKDIREKLSGVRALQMTIVPVSQPTINGDRATVQCQRIVTETFSDGTVKQNPSTVSFVLQRRSGRWVIESVQ